MLGNEILLARRNFSKDNKNRRARFTDAPIRKETTAVGIQQRAFLGVTEMHHFIRSVHSKWLLRTLACSRLLFAFLGSILIVGCTNAIRIPLDGTSLSNTPIQRLLVCMDHKLTLIKRDVLTYLLMQNVGWHNLSKGSAKSLLINPGKLIVFTDLYTIPSFIRRQIEIDLKPGEVYFYRTYVQCEL